MGESERLPDEGWFRIPLGDGFEALYVGIDPAIGFSWREVAVDDAGAVVHRCPDERFGLGGRYGWFDPHNPPVSEGTPISRDEFEVLWAQEPVLPPETRPWWSRRPRS